MKAKSIEEAAEEKLEYSKHWFMRLRKEAVSTTQVQGEAASANAEAAASYPGDIAQIINEGGYIEHSR